MPVIQVMQVTEQKSEIDLTRFKTRRLYSLIGLCALALTVSIGAGLAHKGATGIVKERMDAMKSVAASTKALARMQWANVEQARRSAADHARIVSGHADKMVALFPSGSAKHPSEAAPSIWTKPDEFARLAKAMGQAADEIVLLSPTATSNADLSVPFNAMAATCKSCHAGFRIKKQ